VRCVQATNNHNDSRLTDGFTDQPVTIPPTPRDAPRIWDSSGFKVIRNGDR